MPPPVTPYDRANSPGSMGLTQSHDAARQQANREQGYNPDALQRTLDWIGRQFGSDKAARQPGPSAGSRVIDWIGRQFGDTPRVTNPYDRKNPAVDAWFRALENSPTPFGNVQYGPPKPPAKPVTKISSAATLNKKISDSLGPPQEPPPVDPASFGAPPPLSYFASPGEDTGRDPNSQVQWPPPPVNPDVNLSEPPAWPSYAMPLPDYTVPGMSRRTADLPGEFNLIRHGRPPAPRQDSNPSPFNAGYGARARGGPIGLMRGGYPELYGSARMPVRHTFDSGGESFVGSEYSEASGRADDVNAKLSPKEYVIDAETMALLGDGNPDHGAKKMDQMRANIRRQKGAALAKGKISPNARKSAQEYLVGNPMGDGIRRRGKDKG